MKKTIILLFALMTVAGMMTSCMDGGYDDLSDITTQKAYGNDTITEHNVVTLKELRNHPKYKYILKQFRDRNRDKEMVC